MIDFAQEQVVSLAHATKLLPKRRGEKRPHVATMYRWTTCGVKGILLETIQVGGTRCTSVEALQRFFEALSALDHGQVPALPPLSPERKKEYDLAEARLKAKGFR